MADTVIVTRDPMSALILVSSPIKSLVRQLDVVAVLRVCPRNHQISRWETAAEYSDGGASITCMYCEICGCQYSPVTVRTNSLQHCEFCGRDYQIGVHDWKACLKDRANGKELK